MDDLTQDQAYSYLKMASKGLKYALKAGIAIGLIGKFGLKLDNIMDLVLASGAAMGLLTAGYNILKHRFNLKWLP